MGRLSSLSEVEAERVELGAAPCRASLARGARTTMRLVRSAPGKIWRSLEMHDEARVVVVAVLHALCQHVKAVEARAGAGGEGGHVGCGRTPRRTWPPSAVFSTTWTRAFGQRGEEGLALVDAPARASRCPGRPPGASRAWPAGCGLSAHARGTRHVEVGAPS